MGKYINIPDGLPPKQRQRSHKKTHTHSNKPLTEISKKMGSLTFIKGTFSLQAPDFEMMSFPETKPCGTNRHKQRIVQNHHKNPIHSKELDEDRELGKHVIASTEFYQDQDSSYEDEAQQKSRPHLGLQEARLSTDDDTDDDMIQNLEEYDMRLPRLCKFNLGTANEQQKWNKCIMVHGSNLVGYVSIV